MNGNHESPAIIRHRIEADPEVDLEAWEEFWPGAVNGTMFHSPRFLSYHPPDRFNDHYLSFRRKGNLVGIFPAVEREEEGVRCWVSHPGASFAGPAWSPRLHYHHLEDLVRALVEYARDAGFGRIRMTIPPVIYNLRPEQALESALRRHGFQLQRWELTQAVELNFNPAALLDTFVNKTRTAYRKAVLNKLQFRVIEGPSSVELDRFWEILVENRRGLGIVPAHSREEVERLHRLVPERLMLAMVEFEGRMVAVIWNFLCNRQTILEFYMAHEIEVQSLKPVAFLTYHTMQWARERGYRWLDFGISSIQGDPTWGLLRFKENFGSRHFLRLSYQRDL